MNPTFMLQVATSTVCVFILAVVLCFAVCKLGCGCRTPPSTVDKSEEVCLRPHINTCVDAAGCMQLCRRLSNVSQPKTRTSVVHMCLHQVLLRSVVLLLRASKRTHWTCFSNLVLYLPQTLLYWSTTPQLHQRPLRHLPRLFRYAFVCPTGLISSGFWQGCVLCHLGQARAAKMS